MAVRDIEKLLGKVDYSMPEKKKKSRQFSRSLYVAEDIQVGEEITEKNIRSVRTGYGLYPKYLNKVLEEKVLTRLEKGTALTWGEIK